METGINNKYQHYNNNNCIKTTNTQAIFSITGFTNKGFNIRLDFPKFQKFKVKCAAMSDPSGILTGPAIYLCSDTLAGYSDTMTTVGNTYSGKPIIATLQKEYSGVTGLFKCDDQERGSWFTVSDTGKNEQLRSIDLYILDNTFFDPASYLTPVQLGNLKINITLIFKTILSTH
jgi:hypothetical protein